MYELLKTLENARNIADLLDQQKNSVELEFKLKEAKNTIDNLIINLQRRSDPNTRTETTQLI